MGAPKPQRLWWRKKRLRILAILWLLFSPFFWPFLLGPMAYATNRGWMPVAAYDAVKNPLVPVLNSS